MSRWVKTILLISSLVLINVAAASVLAPPIDQNCIFTGPGPTIEPKWYGFTQSLQYSFFCLPLLFMIGLLPTTGFIKKICSISKGWSIASMLLIVTLYIAPMHFAWWGASYWTTHSYYPVAGYYLIFSMLLIIFVAYDIKIALLNLSARQRVDVDSEASAA